MRNKRSERREDAGAPEKDEKKIGVMPLWNVKRNDARWVRAFNESHKSLNWSSLPLRFGLLSAAALAVIISNHIKYCKYLQISTSCVCVCVRDKQALQPSVTLLSAALRRSSKCKWKKWKPSRSHSWLFELRVGRIKNEDGMSLFAAVSCPACLRLCDGWPGKCEAVYITFFFFLSVPSHWIWEVPVSLPLSQFIEGDTGFFFFCAAVYALWHAVLVGWLWAGDKVDTDDMADCAGGETLKERDVGQPKAVRRPRIRRVINDATPPV